MKYPIVTLNNIPSPYKSGNKVNVFHLQIDNEEKFIELGNAGIRKEYLEFIKEMIVDVIEKNNVIAQAVAVKSNGEYFVIFKSNLDLKIIKVIINNICLELDEYVKGTLNYQYAFVNCLLVEKGVELGMFKIAKTKEEILDSEEYRQNCVPIKIDKNKKHVKYLTSFEEYKESLEQVGYDYNI